MPSRRSVSGLLHPHAPRPAKQSPLDGSSLSLETSSRKTLRTASSHVERAKQPRLGLPGPGSVFVRPRRAKARRKVPCLRIVGLEPARTPLVGGGAIQSGRTIDPKPLARKGPRLPARGIDNAADRIRSGNVNAARRVPSLGRFASVVGTSAPCGVANGRVADLVLARAARCDLSLCISGFMSPARGEQETAPDKEITGGMPRARPAVPLPRAVRATSSPESLSASDK